MAATWTRRESYEGEWLVQFDPGDFYGPGDIGDVLTVEVCRRDGHTTRPTVRVVEDPDDWAHEWTGGVLGLVLW